MGWGWCRSSVGTGSTWFSLNRYFQVSSSSRLSLFQVWCSKISDLTSFEKFWLNFSCTFLRLEHPSLDQGSWKWERATGASRVVRITNRPNLEAPKSSYLRRIARRSIKSQIAQIVNSDTSSALGTYKASTILHLAAEMGSIPALYTRTQEDPDGWKWSRPRNWRCIWLYQKDRKLVILYLAIFYCFKFIRS